MKCCRVCLIILRNITGPCSDAGNDWPLRWEVRSGVYKKQFLLKGKYFQCIFNCEL